MQINWWMWAVAGLVLLVVELAGPGFFVVFFALGAFLAALSTWLAPDWPFWAHLLVFSLVSALSLVLFRRRLVAAFGLDKGPAGAEEIVAETALPLEDLAPGAAGRAELRGTTWNAKNAGETPLAKGQRCKVEKVEGLTLWLKAD